MKKLSVLLLAAAMVLAFTLPAAAIDHIFGGYWRVRAYSQQNFTGEDATEARDRSATDSRTRLYYTAKFSDDFQFVNKIEFDWTYGENSGSRGGAAMGDIGADGTDLEIKNSYVDFNLMNRALNFKLGMQGYRFGRGFMFDDDFSGAVVTYKGKGFDIPFMWAKAYEGTYPSRGVDRNDFDVDYLVLNPSFTAGGFKLNPFFTYIYSENAAENNPFRNTLTLPAGSTLNDVNVWYLGLNADYKFQGVNLWGTAIYQGGEVDVATAGTTSSTDSSAYLFALGADGAFGPFGLHGQFFYASGDDDAADDDDDAFRPPVGASYYWSEIMGYGIFDQQVSQNSPADQISNVWAANIGADYKILPSLKATLDVWYAARAEELAPGLDEELGTEVDLKLTYQVMKNLNLDLVGAYLFAGDSTNLDVADDENPYEIGARLALSF